MKRLFVSRIGFLLASVFGGFVLILAFQNCGGFRSLATDSSVAESLTSDPTAGGPTDLNSLFVSPNGDDSAVGSVDQPLASLEGARLRVRALKLVARTDRPIVVTIAAGTYRLSATLRFASEDGGASDQSNVIYQAASGARVILSGGVPVTGWTQQGARYRATLPSSDQPARNFFVGDQPGVRAIRARMPKVGYLRETGYQLTEDNKVTSVDLDGGSLSTAQGVHSSSTELVLLKSYAQSRLKVRTLQFPNANGGISITPNDWGATYEGALAPYNASSGLFAPGFRAYFEGSEDFVSEPGEWASSTNSVTFIPRTAADLEAAVVPVLEQLLVIDGASHLQFNGLEFRHTTWRWPSTFGYVGIQGGRMVGDQPFVPSGVSLANATDVRISGCRFSQFGGGGIEIRSGVSQSSIAGNYLSDIAANGISIDNPTITDANVTHDVAIENNILQYIGVDYDGTGIVAGYTRNLSVARNRIQHVSYTGVSIGWFALPAGMSGVGNNQLNANDISDVMMLYDDGGGIYTPGPNPGTQITRNYVHDFLMVPVQPTGPGLQTGLYFDGSSSGVRASGNVLARITQGVFFQSSPGAEASGDASVKTSFVEVDLPLAHPDLNSADFRAQHGIEFSTDTTTDLPASVIAGAGPDDVTKAHWASLTEKVPPGFFGTRAGIYRYDGHSYCGFASWNAFVTASGRMDTKGLLIYERLPADGVSAGLCP